jgi:translation initiation factor IF-2
MMLSTSYSSRASAFSEVVRTLAYCSFAPSQYPVELKRIRPRNTRGRATKVIKADVVKTVETASESLSKAERDQPATVAPGELSKADTVRVATMASAPPDPRREKAAN